MRQGETIYIKYYTDAADAVLCYADHGRKSDGWRAIGPALLGSVGTHPNEPVILKITNVGTPKSTVAWINGHGKSGIWSGLPAPGPYDLALHDEARWTLPPIVITEAPKSSLWSNLMGWLNTPTPPAPTGTTYSVPDGGITALLFVLALASMAVARRIRS